MPNITQESPLRVLVAVTEPLLASGIAAVLRQGRVDVRVARSRIARALERAAESVDILLLDRDSFADLSPTAALREARMAGVRVAVLVESALEANDLGYLVDAVVYRSEDGARLLDRLGRLRHSEAGSRVRERPTTHYRIEKPLTAREGEIVELIRQGYKNREIGLALGIREQSVKNVVSRMMRDRNLRNRVELLRWSEGSLGEGS